MINSVRNTVLSVLNKNNYGYISPSDFNLFAKQAQMDIFENYFYQYNNQINKENTRQSGTGYADVTKGIEEVIDMFSVSNPLSKSAIDLPTDNQYFLPSQTTTGDDYYIINKVLVYTTPLSAGITDGTSGGSNKCIDSSALFITDGVKIGDTVALIREGITQYVTVKSDLSETGFVTTDSTVSVVVWNTTGIIYQIYKNDIQEAEKVTHSKITMLNNSLLTAPSLIYPAYTEEALLLKAFPSSINEIGRVLSQYIRYPNVPKWTYVTLGASGEPSFDQSQSDYQDFELPLDDEGNLVKKILQYAGMSIREASVVQFAGGLEGLESQQQQ
jgi:hypothetical protein|tara:strand:+ start:2159 stop:3145 length:987 start_codon:yes stop_codon:yes gene_type:complete